MPSGVAATSRPRPPRRVLVAAGPGDEHAVAVAVALSELGLEPVRVDLARLPSLGLSVAQGEGQTVEVARGGETETIDPAARVAAWWRRPADLEPPAQADSGARRLWTGRGLPRGACGRAGAPRSTRRPQALARAGVDAGRARGLAWSPHANAGVGGLLADVLAFKASRDKARKASLRALTRATEAVGGYEAERD